MFPPGGVVRGIGGDDLVTCLYCGHVNSFVGYLHSLQVCRMARARPGTAAGAPADTK